MVEDSVSNVEQDKADLDFELIKNSNLESAINALTQEFEITNSHKEKQQ